MYQKVGLPRQTERLFSLERRRRRGDLIETLKILKQFDNVNPDQFFERSTTTNLRGHKLKLFKKECQLQVAGISSVNESSMTRMICRKRLWKLQRLNHSKSDWTST